MNIFKKQINLSFFQKIELRVLSDLREKIKQKKKQLHKRAIAILVPSSLLLCVSTFFFYINSNSVPSFSWGGFVFSFITTFFGSIFYVHHIYTLNLKISEHNLFSFLLDNPSFWGVQHLNEEELNELFSLSLDASQIDFLQKKIISQGYLTLENLIQLPSLDKEIEQTFSEQQQEKLNTFFSQNKLPINEYAQLVELQVKENKKEMALSSRL